jgi:predicted nuclease of restriction endonuclease-like (RecB) superfamily
MRSLAEVWRNPEIVPQLVALLPWGHLRLLMDRVNDPTARDWYIAAAVREGWNRDAFGHLIDGQLYAREGKSLTNFGNTLPPQRSEMALQLLRDRYNFDFLTLTYPFEERKLERGLLTHMRDLALGTGSRFCFHWEPGAADDRG